MYELRLCVTNMCNYRCEYCRAGGEGLNNLNPVMNLAMMEYVIRTLVKVGYSKVRLTGGEPLLRSDITEIINAIYAIDQIDEVTMVTNGSRLNDKMIQKLRQSALSEITISLDTLDAEEYKKITKVDCLNRVILNIIQCRKAGMKVRINMVVTKQTSKQVVPIVDFCREYKMDLKLLDLNNVDLISWESQFYDLKELYPYFEHNFSKGETKYLPGNVGSPMEIFTDGNIKIFVKSCGFGTNYSNICNACKYYPCQTGVVSSIVTHDGMIKLCALAEKEEFNLFDVFNRDQLNKFMNIHDSHIFCKS